MKETDLVLAGIIAFVVVSGMVMTVGVISDRMRYQAFLTAQANVLTCRSDNVPVADRICGPVPTFKDFK